jgi:hypothetical protein
LRRDELAGPRPTPIEALLAERVMACWLAVQHAEQLYARQDVPDWCREDQHQRRIEYANRRLLNSLKSLALVRRLAVPVLFPADPPASTPAAPPPRRTARRHRHRR